MSLTLAVLEWLLILMLFIDASFSYLVTKFARYCGLQVPCLLCSRLDHVLGNVKSKFYWDLICGNHKSEISSLVLCHGHNKLVDVHETCENCLFSFATINKSNSETYRLLVGKMGDDPHFTYDRDPLLEDHKELTRICSCCNAQWVPKGYAQNLLHTTTSIGSLANDELDAPLLETIEHDRHDIKKIKNETYVSLGNSDMEKTDFDPHSHIEYKKVKINSDTESEVPFSDDDKDDFGVHCEKLGPQIVTLSKDLSMDELIRGPEPSSVLESLVQREIVVPAESITVDIGHGLEELNWQNAEHKADISPPSDFISFDEVPPSSIVAETPIEVLEEKYNAPDASEVEKKPVTETEDHPKSEINLVTATTETHLGVKPVTNETNNFQMPNYLELGDAYKLAIGNKGRQLSGKFSEQRALKDAARVSEDLKVLLSQMSFTRGVELNDISPRLSGNIEEYKNSDSSSFGMQFLQRRASLERNESNLSLDGSSVSEIEGESMVDRLKRQVEHDRKLMGALYKELEEERNASAVATNQAMAMITRLQEEKAALNMEALQCLRVMEEQAEHDDEELQKANELLAERETEMGDLEADLELCKRKLEEMAMVDMEEVDDENILLYKERRIQELEVELELYKSKIKDVSMLENSIGVDQTNKHDRIGETSLSFDNKNVNADNGLVLDFEDERLYILECLKKLEKELHLFSNNGVYLDTANGEHSGDEINSRVQGNDGTEEEDLQKNDIVYKEDTDLSSLRKELFDLSDRLETLEADRNFLEHSINSLRSGNEGLKFIEEIACHLRELHRIGIRRDQPCA